MKDNILKSIDTGVLQQVRYKHSEEQEWLYGYYIGTSFFDKHRCLSMTLRALDVCSICEPYDWEKEVLYIKKLQR